MRKFSSTVGQFASEVKAFATDHLSWAHLRQTVTHAVNTVFPGGKTAVTGEQWARIRFLDREGCDMCARPFDGGLHLGQGAHCDACTTEPFPFRRGRAACLYGGESRDLILAFKHGDRLDLVPMLARWLERAGADILHEADAVVPVPLHWRRLLTRRYNQAAELARPLARRTGCRYLPDVLKRIKPTPRQKNNAAERWANVRTAFATPQTGQRAIAGKKIVLIDDVFTTGATLKACARELLRGGAASVDVLVLARAVKTDA